MSYGLGIPTFEANKIGVRRVYTLGFLSSAPDPDTRLALIANGYDSGTIDTLITFGATDEQLLALPYPAGSDEMSAAVSNLMNILSGAQAAPGQGAQTAASYPQSAIPAYISTPFGGFDLAVVSEWNRVSTLFQQVGPALSVLAAAGDAQAIAYKSQYNNLVSQFGSVWQQAMNSASPVKTLAGLGDVSTTVTTGIIVIAGVAVAATVGLPITLTVGSIAAGLYVIYQYIQSRNAQTAVAQTAANTSATQAAANAAAAAAAQNTANSLIQQANSMISSANALPASQATQAAQLRANAQALLTQAGGITSQIVSSTAAPLAPGSLTAWFTQNATTVLLVLGLIVIAPPLIKKL